MKNPKLQGQSPKSGEPSSSPGKICNLNCPIFNLQGLLLLALLFVATPSRAQSYSIDWSSLGGGGGTSTGGAYSVSGSVGQADAGALSGGGFTLVGGFWSLAATVPIPGGPTVSVSGQGGVLKIAWLKPADRWVLESTLALSGPSLKWTAVPQPYQDDGTNLYILLNAPSGGAFYRLHKP